MEGVEDLCSVNQHLEDMDCNEQHSNSIGDELDAQLFEVPHMITVDGVEDMGNINFKVMSCGDVKKYSFLNLEVAYTFYNMYGRVNGFSARKNKVVRSKGGDILQQSFVYHK